METFDYVIVGAGSAGSVLANRLTEDGKTTVIAPAREYHELAVNQLDDGFRSSPAVAGKALFLRTEKNLYRVEKK